VIGVELEAVTPRGAEVLVAIRRLEAAVQAGDEDEIALASRLLEVLAADPDPEGDA
jgi:hypothetical protein